MSRAYRVGWTGHAPGNRELCVTAQARTQLRDMEEPAGTGAISPCALLLGETGEERCVVYSLVPLPAGPVAEHRDELREALGTRRGGLVGYALILPGPPRSREGLLEGLGTGWGRSSRPPCDPIAVLCLCGGKMEAYWVSTRGPTEGQHGQYRAPRSPSKRSASFHHTNFGTFGMKFWICMDGFVATSIREVQKLEWPNGKPSAERAAEIAAWNRTELKRAQSRLTEWQQ